jgi:hypothetical protein
MTNSSSKKVCDIVVAKQNFSRRHSHGLQIVSGGTNNIQENKLKYCEFTDEANLAYMSESELNSFLEWMQDTDNMFS